MYLTFIQKKKLRQFLDRLLDAIILTLHIQRLNM